MDSSSKNQNNVLYTTTTRARGSTWARGEVYAIRGGRLEHVAHLKYQPGASAGHAREARAAYDRAWDTTDATDNRWEVREIDPTL
jgi:hypothetical protein